jgi:hypothetical protein
MGKKRNWDQIGELISKIKDEGLSLKEGSLRAGISPWILYDYKRRRKEGKIRDSVESGLVSDKPAKGGVYLPVEIRNLILESPPRASGSRVQTDPGRTQEEASGGGDAQADPIDSKGTRSSGSSGFEL